MSVVLRNWTHRQNLMLAALSKFVSLAFFAISIFSERGLHRSEAELKRSNNTPKSHDLVAGVGIAAAGSTTPSSRPESLLLATAPTMGRQ